MMEEDITQGNRTEYAEHLRLNIPYGLSPRSSSIFESLSIVSSEDDYRPSISASDSYEMSDMERSIRLTPSTGPQLPLSRPRCNGHYMAAGHNVGNEPASSDHTPLSNLHQNALDRPGRPPLVVSESGLRKRRGITGWRFGVTSCACTATAVFFINIGLTIWIYRTFPIKSGIATLLSGDCSKTRTWGLWLHLGIDALSTVLLAASSYTMQRLLAPTRQEVDKAHVNGRWVAIGVPSMRNTNDVNLKRVVLFALLTFTSTPLHVL